MFDLTGQAALITGATGGIGGNIARAFHARGATVTLSGTRKEALEELAHELGERTFVVPANLSDAESVESLVPAAEAAMGSFDILINNAGITRDNLFIRMKDDEWLDVMRVNLEAIFRLSRAAAKSMMKRRYGRILSITSIIGTIGNAGQANYSAAKAAIAGMSKSLAIEVATRNITVNCLAPGFIETPMTDVLSEKQRELALQRVPMGRFGKTDEIAAAAVFLSSREASYITGQTLHVNGGIAMI